MTRVSRRRFLQVTAASSLLAGCTISEEGWNTTEPSRQITTVTPQSGRTSTSATATSSHATTLYDDVKQLSVVNRTTSSQTVAVTVQADDGRQLLSETFSVDEYRSVARDNIISDPGTYRYEATLDDESVTAIWTPESRDEIELGGVRVFVPEPGVVRATVTSPE